MIAVENPHPFVTTCFIRNTPLTRRLTVSIFILTEDAWWKQFGTSGNCSSFRLRGYRVQEYGATQRFQVRSILHFLVNINQTVRKRETLSIKGGGGRRNVHFYQLFDRCANKSTNSWTSRGRNFQANTYSSFFPLFSQKTLRHSPLRNQTSLSPQESQSNLHYREFARVLYTSPLPRLLISR